MIAQLFKQLEFLMERVPKKVSTDSGLIKYLMRHRHSTPFEMCEIKYHVKLPIFVLQDSGLDTELQTLTNILQDIQY